MYSGLIIHRREGIRSIDSLSRSIGSISLIISIITIPIKTTIITPI